MKRQLCIAICGIMIVGTLGMSGCGAQTSETVQTVGTVTETETEADDKAETATKEAEEPSGSEKENGAEAAEETSDTGENTEEEKSMTEFELSDGITLPELSIPDLKVPETEANAFIRDMGVGFNLGNTFDAYSDPTPSDEMSTETCWHGTYTTQQMIKDIHSYGFETIRIPVSWHNHVDGDLNISSQWLDRVNEVVDWAIDEGMYVIVDIHHDNHEAAHGLYPDNAHLEQSKKYITRIWEQLSERFKDYDDHLIFEAMNEPRLVDHENEWWLDLTNPDCKEAVMCINELNQIFVDTVRASGGNNATRYLMVPGYCASVDGGTNAFFELPADIDGNEQKIILSIHAYTPYNFALEYPGIKNFDCDDKESTADINNFMNKLYMDYVTQGVPIVIGEFGARDKGGNLQDRVDYAAYFVRMAKARNIACIWWDNNEFTGSGELFGIYDRNHPENSNTDIIAALLQ